MQDAEIFRSEAPDVDFDLKNQQNLDYSKANLVSHASSSVSKHEKDVHMEPNNFQDSLNKFKQVSDQEMVKRSELKRSKQAIIAGRLLRIKAEMQTLDAQLKQNTQQSVDGNDLESLEALKGQLDGIYQTQAFQNLLLNRKDVAGAFQRKDVLGDEQIKASGKDKLNLDSLVSTLKKEKQQEESKDDDEQVVDLVFDRSKKDMATLMRLNSLKKRVHFIKHVLGDWKPTPRYKTLTD